MKSNHRWTSIWFLVVWCVIMVFDHSVRAIPLASEAGSDLFKLNEGNDQIARSEPVEISYQDHEEFKKEIRDNLDALVQRKGVLFDRILLVNDIHKRWKNKYDETKRNAKRNAEDTIIQNNLEDDNLYFEADMVLDRIDKEIMKEKEKNPELRKKRNAVHRRKKIWTSRQIPYKIDYSLSSNAKDVILKAIKIVHEKTCVRWINYNPSYHRNYVLFKKDSGCFSTIGKAYLETGAQILSIGEGCEWVGTALHEMTHAMGFFHEQSRDDRDRHVEIIWANIPVEFQDQFQKYSHGTIDKMGVDYDYRSIMHYSSTAFGNGRVTIRPIDSTKKIGDAENFSELDVVEINSLYDCKTSSALGYSSWSPWTECDRYCYKERQRFCFDRNKAKCPNSNVYGIQSEQVKCTATECPAPIDGNWGRWGAWGACSKSCDEGKRQRTRLCNKPAPDAKGAYCIGESSDIGVCLNRRCDIGSYDVDFENGWGMWFTATNADIRWTPHTGPVKTLHTGPLGDHTLQGQGNYVYVESSRRQKGEKAMLVSKEIEFKEPHCLSFYYTMHGALMGSLTLSLAPAGGGTWTELLSKSGNQGPDWHSAAATIDYTGKLVLVFQATLGGRGTSDIALDDIFIDKGACSGYVKPTTKCEDLESRCSTWAKNGECNKTPDYMHQNCKASCGLCPKQVCEDLESGCSTWAKTGECDKNPGYMDKNCKESCGLCPKQVCEDFDYQKCGHFARKGGCTTDKQAAAKHCKESCGMCPEKPCKDNDQYREKCKKWANVDGECFNTPDFMFKYCKKSCGICNGCADESMKCITWAAGGECQRNPTYMHKSCKASCGLCGDCKDTYKDSIQCGIWAKDGNCQANPGFMLIHCKKSCTGCPEPCKDNNTECPKWAGENECEKNPTWMGANCKKSCRKC